MNTARQPAFDTEGLQADVMRFMAIIAFCLIAIMTLVKDLPATTTDSLRLAEPAVESPSEPAEQPEPQPENKPEPVFTATEQPATTPVPTVTKPPIAQPVDTTPPAVVQETPETVTAINDTPLEAAPIEPEPAAAPAPIEETLRPLSLQFSSDTAFIRLIANERIALYAKSGSEFQQLTRSFGTEPARVHGDLYEVMPDSLPSGVRKLFSDADLFLVRLSAETMRQVSELLEQHAEDGGQLLIDQRGNVRHASY